MYGSHDALLPAAAASRWPPSATCVAVAYHGSHLLPHWFPGHECCWCRCCCSNNLHNCVDMLCTHCQPGARLIGIEYIISRRLYEGLPQEEHKYWHSHQYEVGMCQHSYSATAAWIWTCAAASGSFMFGSGFGQELLQMCWHASSCSRSLSAAANQRSMTSGSGNSPAAWDTEAVIPVCCEQQASKNLLVRTGSVAALPRNYLHLCIAYGCSARELHKGRSPAWMTCTTQGERMTAPRGERLCSLPCEQSILARPRPR
jgi:hypothetical protein